MKTSYKTLYLERNGKIIPIEFHKSKVVSYLHYRFTQIDFDNKLNKDGYIILGRDIAYTIDYYIQRAIEYREKEIEKLNNMQYSELLKKYFNIYLLNK